MNPYYANKVRHQLQDVLRMTDANPAFVTASEVCGFHGFRVGPKWAYFPQHYFLHYASYGARIVKHREGGRGDVVLASDDQSVWAVNPQEILGK